MNSGERGIALVEAILVGLVFLVPLIWAVAVLDQVHRAALGSTTAAREAGFAVTRSMDPRGSLQATDPAIGFALKGQGLDPARALVHLSLVDGTSRGGLVRIEVRYPVSVADLPVIGRLPPVWVTARHDAVIDRYRSR